MTHRAENDLSENIINILLYIIRARIQRVDSNDEIVHTSSRTDGLQKISILHQVNYDQYGYVLACIYYNNISRFLPPPLYA